MAFGILKLEFGVMPPSTEQVSDLLTEILQTTEKTPEKYRVGIGFLDDIVNGLAMKDFDSMSELDKLWREKVLDKWSEKIDGHYQGDLDEEDREDMLERKCKLNRADKAHVKLAECRLENNDPVSATNTIKKYLNFVTNDIEGNTIV